MPSTTRHIGCAFISNSAAEWAALFAGDWDDVLGSACDIAYVRVFVLINLLVMDSRTRNCAFVYYDLHYINANEFSWTVTFDSS